MTFHHLPPLLAHLASATRHALTYWHAATQAVGGAIFQLQSPRDAFRVALRQGRFASKVRLGTPLGKPPLLIHYHIYKNAGTSFEWALQQTFGPSFRQYDSREPGGTVSAREIARLAWREPAIHAISSHQAMPPAPRALGRRVLTSILIRDPVARIGSIYAFERQQEEQTPGARKAKELDFKGYVEWRLATSPSLLCNYQVSVCSGRRKSKPQPCTERDLEAAIIRLDGLDIVGTVRRYEEWLALAEAVLKQYFDGVSFLPVHHNRFSNAGESEPEILARLLRDLGLPLTRELLKQNELDMTLHQVADALLTRRLAERSVAVTLRDLYAGAKG